MNVMHGNRFRGGLTHAVEVFPNCGFTLASSAIHGLGLVATRTFRKGEAIARLSGNLVRGSDALSDPNYIGIGREAWIDPVLPFCSINHHCAPNAAFGVKRYIYAVDEIAADEEITIDYSTTEADPDWEMSCRCGARKCRGTLRAIQFDYPNLNSSPLATPLMLSVWRRALARSPFPLAP